MKVPHEFAGRWRITQMSAWDQSAVDLVGPGYFLFTEGEDGEFSFCALKGWMECRFSYRTPLVEFTWQGRSEGDDVFGRGKVEFETPDIGYGEIFIHGSEESRFVIERET